MTSSTPIKPLVPAMILILLCCLPCFAQSEAAPDEENCLICPLEKWCKDPEGTYQTIVKLLYLYASSGQKEWKQQTEKHIERFLDELAEYKDEFKRRLN